jgi:hypothetical protein
MMRICAALGIEGSIPAGCWPGNTESSTPPKYLNITTNNLAAEAHDL